MWTLTRGVVEPDAKGHKIFSQGSLSIPVYFDISKYPFHLKPKTLQCLKKPTMIMYVPVKKDLC